MIAKGFILAKDNCLITTKILRDHGRAPDNSKKRLRGSTRNPGLTPTPAVGYAAGTKPALVGHASGSHPTCRLRQRLQPLPAGYASDTKRNLSPTPATLIGDVDGVGERRRDLSVA
jgi:hypothetical protein